MEAAPRPARLAPLGWLDGPPVRLGQGEPSLLGHYLGPGAVHAVGVFHGEPGLITFDDGVLWVGRHREGRWVAERIEPGTSFAGAADPLLLAQVLRWQRVVTLLQPATIEGLFEAAARAARSRAASIEGVPFRIEGRFEEVTLRLPGPHGVVTIGVPSVSGHLVGVLGAHAAEAMTGVAGPGVMHLTAEVPSPTMGAPTALRAVEGSWIALPADD